MSITSNAYSKIADYDQLSEAIKRVWEEQSKHRTRRVERTFVTSADFVDSALSGSAFPESLIEEKEAHEKAVRDSAMRAQMLKEARTTLEHRLNETIRTNSDPALNHLDETLQKLVSKVRQSAPVLRGLPDAAAILARRDPEAMDAWDRLERLLTRYKELRGAQIAITRACISREDLHFIYEVGFVRNSLDESTHWQERRQSSYSVAMRDDQDQHVRNYNEWLVAFQPAVFPHSRNIIPVAAEDERSFLLQLCTTTNLWVPTVSQLLKAGEMASAATVPVDYTRLQGMEDVRDEYYDLTGSTPANRYTRSSGPRRKRTKHKPSLAESYGSAFMGL